ncbi:hypothetical protein AVEN_159271-1 [Araneus ventricosus]|uniref:Uncharacterized protein n=1 Tax=Araneus ventricosus TaxID=182803 RepID=A0A4Y2A0E6_ARAVE|nr:hypothetical protein AVEN_159271-1 [Araneus ventricosus]
MTCLRLYIHERSAANSTIPPPCIYTGRISLFIAHAKAGHQYEKPMGIGAGGRKFGYPTSLYIQRLHSDYYAVNAEMRRCRYMEEKNLSRWGRDIGGWP